MASLVTNTIRRLFLSRVSSIGQSLTFICSSSSASKSSDSLISMDSPTHMLPIWQRYKPDASPLREQYLVASEREQTRPPKWYPHEHSILRITLKRYVFITNFKPVKQIFISFDPFHEESFSIR